MTTLKVVGLCLVLSLFSVSQVLASLPPGGSPGILSNDPYNCLIWNSRNPVPGARDDGDWFEWWYFKVIEPETRQSFYFVYGVVNPWDQTRRKAASRAYVGFGDFKEHVNIRRDFPVSAFQSRQSATVVKIGENFATDRELKGQLLDDEGNPVSWDLTLEPDWKWNAMGWTREIPEISNIYWYPAQASARMSGTIRSKGKTYVLDRAPAYQDRNWGRSFPGWWTWIVSNHFEKSPGTVLAAGGGNPEIFGFYRGASGVNIGLRHKGRVYQWRVADGDKIDFDIRFGKWEVEASNGHHRIQLRGAAPADRFMDLKFITPQGAEYHDLEALEADIDIILYEKSDKGISSPWVEIDRLHSSHGGLEFGSADASLVGQVRGEIDISSSW